ncbi:MAG: ribonuclease HII [Candidatus Hadarchaeales archaeon]
MTTAGLDEAGRGPILGPMVLCGVSFEERDLPRLREAGVRDSKLLSPQRREKLAEVIGEIAVSVELVELQAQQIDELRKSKNLNEIEAEIFARIINNLNPSSAYVDSPDPDPHLFEQRLRRYLKKSPRLVVENGADRKYVQASAASILAKQRREERVKELHEKYGDFGSGYLTDPRTISFLRKWIREHGELPDFARKSWKLKLR